MPHLTVATYNTYRERKGRDPVLDELLAESRTLACLQEVGMTRALEIRRRFGRRVHISPVMYGWQFLATILPEDARFVERRTVQLNSHLGLVPKGWSLRRVVRLYRERRHGWSDGLSPRAVQVSRVLWRDRQVVVMNTHLPYEFGLRDRCLTAMLALIREEPLLLVGDLNATTKDIFLKDLLLTTGLRAAGPGTATHNSRRRIDYVLYRDGFREVGYGMKKGRSDHRLVKVELEV